MVRYLLQLGANVNIETSVRKTQVIFFYLYSKLLFLAYVYTTSFSLLSKVMIMIVKLLLEHGASPNKTNKVR